MEFDKGALELQEFPAVEVFDARRIASLSSKAVKCISDIIKGFGQASAKAQDLKNPITTMTQLQLQGQRLYLCFKQISSSRIAVLGGLKTGRKRLQVLHFYSNKYKDIEPVCCLDFFVLTRYQRSGVGKRLFEVFLDTEQLTAEMAAYDRPSVKLLEFLKRHYGLTDYIQQANHFVIYHTYWAAAMPPIADGSALPSYLKGAQGSASHMDKGLQRNGEPSLPPSLGRHGVLTSDHSALWHSSPADLERAGAAHDSYLGPTSPTYLPESNPHRTQLPYHAPVSPTYLPESNPSRAQLPYYAPVSPTYTPDANPQRSQALDRTTFPQSSGSAPHTATQPMPGGAFLQTDLQPQTHVQGVHHSHSAHPSGFPPSHVESLASDCDLAAGAVGRLALDEAAVVRSAAASASGLGSRQRPSYTLHPTNPAPSLPDVSPRWQEDPNRDAPYTTQAPWAGHEGFQALWSDRHRSRGASAGKPEGSQVAAGLSRTTSRGSNAPWAGQNDTPAQPSRGHPGRRHAPWAVSGGGDADTLASIGNARPRLAPWSSHADILRMDEPVDGGDGGVSPHGSRVSGGLSMPASHTTSPRSTGGLPTGQASKTIAAAQRFGSGARDCLTWTS